MRYRVRGVHRESGKVIDQTVEASSEESVRRKAEAKGVTIVAIDAVLEQQIQPAEARRVEAPLASPANFRPEQGHVHGAPVINVAMPKRGSSMGVASIVLGILAFLICWLPLIGIIGIPLSALGLLLAVIGFFVAVSRDWSGVGFPIAGGAVNALALFIAGSQVVAIGALTHGAIKASGDAAAAAAASTPTPRMAIGEAASFGNVRITVTEATIGLVETKEKYGTDTWRSENPALQLALLIENASGTRRVEYRPFHEYDGGFGQEAAGLMDNFGNRYRRITFGLSVPAASAKAGALNPGASVADAIVFEVPVENATQLQLDLPGECVGEQGVFAFTIDVGAIKRVAPPEEGRPAARLSPRTRAQPVAAPSPALAPPLAQTPSPIEGAAELAAYQAVVKAHRDAMTGVLRDAHAAVEASKRAPRPGSKVGSVRQGELMRDLAAARTALKASVAELRKGAAAALLAVNPSTLPDAVLEDEMRLRACVQEDLKALDNMVRLLANSTTKRFDAYDDAEIEYMQMKDTTERDPKNVRARTLIIARILAMPTGR